jgi:hypothetical protein
MFKVRNFLILAFLFAAAIAITWYSFRRTNYDANAYENGVDVTAPFYETEASAPYGEHSSPGETHPAENEIKGGNDSTKTLMDSSINEGTKQPEGEHGHGH